MTKRRKTFSQLSDRLNTIMFGGMITSLIPGTIIFAILVGVPVNLATLPFWWNFVTVVSIILWFALFVFYWMTFHEMQVIKKLHAKWKADVMFQSLDGKIEFKPDEIQFRSYEPTRVFIENGVSTELPSKYFVHLRTQRVRVEVSEKVYKEIISLNNP